MPTPDQIRQAVADIAATPMRMPFEQWQKVSSVLLGAADAIDAEREACAKLAETAVGDWERDTPGRTESMTREGIAAAIRNRT